MCQRRGDPRPARWPARRSRRPVPSAHARPGAPP
jgi:hypothetical protein